MTGDNPSDLRLAPFVADALLAYAAGEITGAEARGRLGLRDHATLLVTLGEAGLTPPRPTEAEVEGQAALFERVWLAA